MTINQWVPAAHAGDAVGGHILRVRDALRARGLESDVFAMTIDPSLAGDVLPWDEPASRDGDVTILHFASASDMSRAFGSLPGIRVLQYHNITPSHFLAPYDAGLAREVHLARQQLASLAARTDLAIGVSEFNRAELESLGFRLTAVAPVFVDLDGLRAAPRVPALEWGLQDGLTNILFVGRIAPNKRIDDHIRLAEHYKRYVDTEYRFIFVGRQDAVPGYFAAVQSMISTYRMLPERFVFPGSVPLAELAAYYRNAHAYVSLSEHEGFCVPLVEAMAMDVPVLASADAAVPETLGGAGVTFQPRDLEVAAELLGGLIYDAEFRAGVIAGQRARVRDFEADRVEPALDRALAMVIA